MNSKLRLRVAAAAGSIVAVAPLAVLARHDLIHSKPFRETFRPLAESLSALGQWMPVLVFGAALLVVLGSRGRALVVAPVAAVLIGASVALAAFQVACGRVLWSDSDFPAGHDLGVGTVAAAFTSLVREQMLCGLLPGVVAVAVLAYMVWKEHAAAGATRSR